jgi:hypothetical protein
MKKMKSLLLLFMGILYLFLTSAVYAQKTDVLSNADALSDIKVEHSIDSSIVSTNINSSLSSGHALSDIRLSGKVDHTGKLRSLSICFSADASFVPSGEAEIMVSEKERITLYSSSIQRRMATEKTSYTLTYLSGLGDIAAENFGKSQNTVFMDLFSKTNKAERLGIPSDFFEFLRAPMR